MLGDSKKPVRVGGAKTGTQSAAYEKSQCVPHQAVPTVRLISPVVAPVGTVTVRLFVVAAVTVAPELHGVGAGRGAEVLPPDRYGLPDGALCRGKAQNRRRGG